MLCENILNKPSCPNPKGADILREGSPNHFLYYKCFVHTCMTKILFFLWSTVLYICTNLVNMEYKINFMLCDSVLSYLFFLLHTNLKVP